MKRMPFTGDLLKKGAINRRSVLYGAAVLSASGMFMQLLGFLYRIALTRFIGAEGMGVYSLVFPVYSVIVSVSLSGLAMAVSNLSSGLYALRSYDGMRKLVRIAVGAFLALFSVMAVPTLLFHREIAVHLLGDERTSFALMVFLPCIFLTGFENICKAVFYGIRHVNRPVLSELLEQILRIAAVCFLLWYAKPADPGTAAALIIAGMTISEVFSSSFMALSTGGLLKRLGKGVRSDTSRIGASMLAIALPVSLSALTNNLLSSANTVLLPSRLMAGGMERGDAVAALGVIMGMALPLVSFPLSLVGSLAAVISPKLAESFALGDRADLRRKTMKSLEMTGLLALPATAILAPMSPYLCELIFGQKVGGYYMATLAVIAVLSAYMHMSVSILNGLGKQRHAMFSVVLGGGLHLAIMWVLAAKPAFGIYGFIYGDIAGALLTLALNLSLAKKTAGIALPWGRALGLPLILSLITGLFARAAFLFLSGLGLHPVLVVAVPCLFGALAYRLLLGITGYDLDRYMKTLIPKRNDI